MVNTVYVFVWYSDTLLFSYRYVIEPYYEYPDLLDVLFNFLKTEQTQAIRREVSLLMYTLIK